MIHYSVFRWKPPVSPTVSDQPVIIHGIGVHPNWNDVIYPLRTELPEQGWSTISIQAPILPNEAEPKDYAPLIKEIVPRIQAADNFLKQNN